eukprot:40953_1
MVTLNSSILNPSDCINGGDDALSHQQIGIELAKQQQIGIELAALHEKVQHFVQQQAQQVEQQAAVHVDVINKSNTSIPPTNHDTNNNDNTANSIKSDGNINNPTKSANNKSSLPQSAPNNNDKTNTTSNSSDKPSIPPPLQLQTSINNVVTGAVAAAMYSPPNAKQTVNNANATNFGFNHNNINVNTSCAQQAHTYAQQAHTYAQQAHTYAYPPNYQQLPHHNHHQIQGGTLIQPLQPHFEYTQPNPPRTANTSNYQQLNTNTNNSACSARNIGLTNASASNLLNTNGANIVVKKKLNTQSKKQTNTELIPDIQTIAVLKDISELKNEENSVNSIELVNH